MNLNAQNNVTSERQFEKVCTILDAHNRNPQKLISILQVIQQEYRYLPKPVLQYVATSLNLSPAHVYGVATFYSHFALEPKGKFVIKICDGTACHVKGSTPILEALTKRLKLKEGETTTRDLLFTLETVSCLGACGLAPAMVINEDVYGQISAQRAVEIIDEIAVKEANHADS
ncbi:NADH-quinone oxidoreductase subunit NuoE [bacterium]|nr:NADH-quinone oxidoreductase subunit NuoE [bacterium]